MKDASGEVEFTGRMASANDRSHIGCPMPGLVEKVHVTPGAQVAEGDILFTVSAMKMEVHVKAPYAATCDKLCIAAGDRVVEGGLLGTLIVKQPTSQNAAAKALIGKSGAGSKSSTVATGSADSTMAVIEMALDDELQKKLAQNVPLVS